MTKTEGRRQMVDDRRRRADDFEGGSGNAECGNIRVRITKYNSIGQGAESRGV